MNKNLCPTCKQDMRAMPREGLRGKGCPQCGQGIKWRFAAKLKSITVDRRAKGKEGKS